MRILIQRAKYGRVSVGDERVGEIGPGLVILVGVGQGDGARECAYLAEKTANLRIFEDDQGKMNRSLLETGGEALVISQFTLYGDARKGRRPAFVQAAAPEIARPLVDAFADHLRGLGIRVQTGSFGAEMLVELANDGPVTIWLDSAEMLARPPAV